MCPCCFQTNKALRISPTRRKRKRQKGLRQGPELELYLAADWVGWLASGHWRFRDLDPSSRLDRLWRPWLERASGGAVGGLTGALIGMGIPEYEAKRYEGRVKDGGILLSVHSDSSEETKRAKEILERTGAQDISSTGEASGDKSTVVTRRDVA